MSSLDLLPTFLSAAGAAPLPLGDPRSHEDRRNRRRAVASWRVDGIDLLPVLCGQAQPARRRLYWRLQGQAAVLDGGDKLIRLSHRPAQMFRPATDAAELSDLAASERNRFGELFQFLAEWESTLPTVPLWGSSPRWDRESARHYDDWGVRNEPR